MPDVEHTLHADTVRDSVLEAICHIGYSAHLHYFQAHSTASLTTNKYDKKLTMGIKSNKLINE